MTWCWSQILLVLLGSVIGCSAPPLAPSERLPFHVAIAPISDSELREYAETVESMDTALEVEGAAFGRELERALSERCFLRTTLLDGTSGEQEAIARALKTGANMLLTCRLWHAREVQQEMNAWATGSFLVFLIGGPFCWFFPDHTYSAELGVSVTLYDLSEYYMLEDRALTDLEGLEMVEFFEHSENLGDLELDFIERAGDSLGYYLVSILIPSPFLATDHEGLTEDFSEIALQALADELAAGLYDRRLELLRNVPRYDFYLLADKVQVDRRPDESLTLSWTVLHDQSQGLNEPGAYRVRAGDYDQSFEVDYDKSFEVTDAQLKRGVTDPRTGQVRHSFQVTLEGAQDASWVQLWLQCYGDTGRARGYTFPVPEQP